MIVNQPDSTSPWTPGGFGAYARHYPGTEWQPVPAERDLTGAFLTRWTADQPCYPEQIRTVVFSPGLFSEFLPGCFAAAKRALGGTGFRIIHTRARSRFSIRDQAARLSAELIRTLEPHERFVWCGHSKGAIELLYALETVGSLRDACAAAVVVQPALGMSRVVDRWQNYPQGLRERIGRALISSPPVRAGVRDISGDRDPVISGWLGNFEPAVPTVCAVSWSIQPTSWVDSYHRTLNEIAPGHAHDGQFLLVDQRIPGASLVCLPELDHAQAVFGGHSFDAGRFWRTLVNIALSKVVASAFAGAQTR